MTDWGISKSIGLKLGTNMGRALPITIQKKRIAIKKISFAKNN